MLFRNHGIGKEKENTDSEEKVKAYQDKLLAYDEEIAEAMT